MITLGSNIIGLRAQRRLNESTSQNAKIAERLSTGMRINSAVDDAAGLAVSGTLNVDVRILGQSLRNLNDGVSLLQIEEGALKELTSIVIRQKELAEQSANGVINSKQRAALHEEAAALTDEFNRIVSITQFNGEAIISQAKVLSLAIGPSGSDLLSVELNSELSRDVGTGIFGASTNYTADQNRDVTLADLNGDGALDVIAAARASTNLNVFLNTGTGALLAATTYTVGNPSPASTSKIVTGDFNGDNALDIAVADKLDNTVSVLLNNGNGTFGARTTFTAATGVNDLTTGDFNSDGIIDIATSGSNSRILFGDGDGTFSTGAAFGPASASLESADINNDGIMDLISIADTTTFLLGSGRGDFSTFSSLATTGVNSGRIADINFDGNLDLVVANYSGTTGSTFTTYLGNGNGSFSSGVAYTTVGSPFPIELADINNDGYQDVVTGGNVGSLMGVHLNNKDGTFSSTGSYAAGGSQYGFAVGDLTGDGVVEIIAGSAFSSSIRVLSQTSTKSSNQSYFSLYRQEDARIALPLLDLTLQRINREVGKIGAYQKRFETAFGTISAMRENYQAAEARITDIDIAAASAEYVRTNILQQIAASIASQANQTPRLVLELLKN